MITLKALQDQFQRYLINSDPQEIIQVILPDQNFSSANRLKVYHDAYRLRLLEILKLDYPKTHTLLGDEHFDAAFHQYLHQHPSHHFSVRYFGQHFSAFLAQTAPFNEHPALAEMACFEGAISHTLDAKDAPIVTAAHFSSLTPQEWPYLVFKLHPSVQSAVFTWDTPQLWQHIDQEKPPRAPAKMPEPVRWLFWRKGIQSFFQSCSAPESIMFDALQNSYPFAQICDELIETMPEDQIPLFIAGRLHRWINEEMICEFSSSTK